MTAILAEYFLTKFPKSAIIYDIRASQVVPETIARNGGTSFANRVGHTHIKARMAKEHAVFGGEVDVVVADGFVGNIMLKTIEGAVKFMGGAIKQEFQSSLFTKAAALVALPALRGFKSKFDPRRFNGAIFLGLRGVVIKSHGGTDATGFMYALEEAYYEAKADSLTKIEQGVAAQLSVLTERRLEAEQAAMANNIE